jgi:hypothetical protein
MEEASVPASFDPAYADHAIRFAQSEEAALTLPGIADVWVHATCFYDDFSLVTSGTGTFWTVGLPNANVARVKRNAAVKTLNYADTFATAPTAIGPTLDVLPSAVRFTLDVRLETGIAIAGNANDHRSSLYINGTLREQVLGRCNAVAGARAWTKLSRALGPAEQRGIPGFGPTDVALRPEVARSITWPAGQPPAPTAF